jgi:hypothetical protein
MHFWKKENLNLKENNRQCLSIIIEQLIDENKTHIIFDFYADDCS